MAAWVHNALTDSFLTAFQQFGPESLPPESADRFVAEQASIGELLRADPLPRTAGSLTQWIVDHPDLAPSAAQASAVSFLREPPFSAPVMLGYRPLFWAAAATLPPALKELLDVHPPPGSLTIGRGAVAFLRWAPGTSPSWRRAQDRARSQPPPTTAVAS